MITVEVTNTISCTCGKSYRHVSARPVGPRVIKNELRKNGWQIGKRTYLCPVCQSEMAKERKDLIEKRRIETVRKQAAALKAVIEHRQAKLAPLYDEYARLTGEELQWSQLHGRN